MLQAIRYSKETGLQILDQLELPLKSVYIDVKDVNDGFTAIKTMQVRGAPAIAIVGMLSVAVDLKLKTFSTSEELRSYLFGRLDYLTTSRPTAVNLSNAAADLKVLVEKLVLVDNLSSASSSMTPDELVDSVEKFATDMLEKDVADNKAMGRFGSEAILNGVEPSCKVSILTHCNTGSLATAGYGTALGVIRSVFKSGRLDRAYCTETRPYNQGARLTAFELVHDKIPSTLVCDDMVALLMQKRSVSAVVVGADRVTANGDTANKIGTYQIAILAKHFSIPFYVCAPFTSIDFSMTCGNKIIIEERSEKEMAEFKGVRVAAPGIDCWNPAFDVTPASLITGIITEKGVISPEDVVKYSQ